MSNRYRLGVDIGTNSIGWCILTLGNDGEPSGILDIGVRIFRDARDPKSRASLAATRRAARAMRRQRDRRLGRKHRLMDELVRQGLMPEAKAERKKLEQLCPYQLRAEGLCRRLGHYEFGRALFHLGQRRGFQSNLKADRKERSGTTKAAQRKLQEMLGSLTLGQFLHQKGVGIVERKLNGKSLGTQRMVRFRPHAKGAKIEYDLYATRAMYRAEFNALWNAQQSFGLTLEDSARDAIADIIFHQRELKPVPIGKCTFEPNDPGRRAPEALPIAQRFRILQELNNLEWIDRERRGHRLDPSQRARILRFLERQKTVSFGKMRTELQLGSEVTFNLESKKRTKLDGDKIGCSMADEARFGEKWWRLSLEEQNARVERLLAEEEEDRFLQVAVEEWKLSPEQAQAVIDAPLPDRHFRLGRIAIRKMLPELEKGVRYHEAAKSVGYDHAKLPTGEVFDELPYYGERLIDHTAEVPSASNPDEREFGRLANPTVHVALNQLRRVVNELIEQYGHPHEIVIELARDLPLGKDDLLKREREQKENQDNNEKMRADIETLLRAAGATDGEVRAALGRGDALLRMRLWSELGKAPDTRCPYTMEQIGVRRLYSHEVHIDHILPFKRTHDDSYANKIICLRRANEIKKNYTPWEAFHNNPAGYDWEDVLLRSKNLPENKRWRFAQDALEQFKRLDRFGIPRELADQFTEQDNFLARHLIDTQYIARLTRAYLTAVCHPNRVWPITGGTTALLRGKWNLSTCLPMHNIHGAGEEKRVRKRRLDHRHHAIDAFIVACTSRSMLQRIASAADDERERLIEKMPEPWHGFRRDELREALSRIVISHRADRGTVGIDPITGRTRTTGALHNDTACFPLSEPDKDGASLVVSRKSISAFEAVEEINDIPDAPLRDELKRYVLSEVAKGRRIKDACAEFAEKTGIRKVRIKERLKVIPIRDRNGRIYKAYKGDSNDYMEIWRLPGGSWTAQTVSTFEANSPQDGNRRRPHPAAKLLMKLYNDDLVRLEDDDGQTRTMRVVKTSKQTIVLADHFESGNLKDRDEKTRKAKKAAKEGRAIEGRQPEDILAETGRFEYLSRAASKLRSMKFRKLHVTAAGRVRDPGPPS